MNHESKKVQRTYLLLLLSSTLATSFIWGVNTLFLLDAGLSNLEAFAANAFFTVGQVVFEVPTGVIADTRGRRTSYLLGAATLLFATLFYLYLWQIQGAFWLWAVASVVLGLGFTFFSGAVEAWLVDALNFTKYDGDLESVFSKGQIVGGVAMLSGSVIGGFVAQNTNLGVPFILRIAMLGVTFVAAIIFMKDLGFSPEKGETSLGEVKKVLGASIKHGLRNPPVRWLMLAAPFTSGVGFYVFYAMQPYLLELYGDPRAYGIAGLAASIVAGSQIVGGLLVPFIRKRFSKRTSVLILSQVITVVALFAFSMTQSFVFAVAILVIWGLVFAASMPVRQAFINDLIPSKQRATVLSFDSLMGSTGGVVIQPVLGRAADVYSYATSFMVAGIIQIAALPFTYFARKERAKSDQIK
jgi:MFS family permease